MALSREIVDSKTPEPSPIGGNCVAFRPYEPSTISLEWLAALLRDMGLLASVQWLRELHATAERGEAPYRSELARLRERVAELNRRLQQYEGRPKPHHVQGYRSPPESDG